MAASGGGLGLGRARVELCMHAPTANPIRRPKTRPLTYSASSRHVNSPPSAHMQNIMQIVLAATLHWGKLGTCCRRRRSPLPHQTNIHALGRRLVRNRVTSNLHTSRAIGPRATCRTRTKLPLTPFDVASTARSGCGCAAVVYPYPMLVTTAMPCQRVAESSQRTG